MDTIYATPQKPGKVQTVGILTLVSGIGNILYMLFLGSFILVGGIASLGIGCLFLPLVVPPLVLGIFEIIYGIKLMANPMQPTQPSTAIAIMEIVCILTGNILALIVGIVALIVYNDEETKAFFARLNGIPQAIQ